MPVQAERRTKKTPVEIPPTPLIQTNLYLYARRQIQLHQSIHCLLGGFDDIQHALMRADLVLIASIFVDVRRNQHGKTLFPGGERYRAFHLRARALCRFDNFQSRDVDQPMIERLQANTDALVLHRDYLSTRLIDPPSTSNTYARDDGDHCPQLSARNPRLAVLHGERSPTRKREAELYRRRRALATGSKSTHGRWRRAPAQRQSQQPTGPSAP